MDVRFVERHLGVREPQRCKACGRVGLVADAIGDLRTVVAQPVGLDDQPELRPVEVDLEAVHVNAGLREGQARFARERQEAALE